RSFRNAEEDQCLMELETPTAAAGGDGEKRPRERRQNARVAPALQPTQE
ncbi:Hypothetical protein NocV09_11600010, partial [Nannochloropsis oceanica]